MPANGDDSNARLDLIERILEALAEHRLEFQREHKHLPTAQIPLTDRMDKSAARMNKFDALMDRNAKAQAEMTKQLKALTDLMDRRLGEQGKS